MQPPPPGVTRLCYNTQLLGLLLKSNGPWAVVGTLGRSWAGRLSLEDQKALQLLLYWMPPPQAFLTGWIWHVSLIASKAKAWLRKSWRRLPRDKRMALPCPALPWLTVVRRLGLSPPAYLATFPEQSSTVPVPEDLVPLPGLCGHCTHEAHRHICTGKTPVHSRTNDICF